MWQPGSNPEAPVWGSLKPSARFPSAGYPRCWAGATVGLFQAGPESDCFPPSPLFHPLPPPPLLSGRLHAVTCAQSGLGRFLPCQAGAPRQCVYPPPLWNPPLESTSSHTGTWHPVILGGKNSRYGVLGSLVKGNGC